VGPRKLKLYTTAGQEYARSRTKNSSQTQLRERIERGCTAKKFTEEVGKECFRSRYSSVCCRGLPGKNCCKTGETEKEKIGGRGDWGGGGWVKKGFRRTRKSAKECTDLDQDEKEKGGGPQAMLEGRFIRQRRPLVKKRAKGREKDVLDSYGEDFQSNQRERWR